MKVGVCLTFFARKLLTIELLSTALDRVMMTRNQKDFWRLWKISLVIALAKSIHRQTYKYFEAGLGAIWRTQLTKQIHDLYFKKFS